MERRASDEFADAIEALMQRPPQRTAVRRSGAVFSALYRAIERRSQEERFRPWFTSQNEITHREARESKLAKAKERETLKAARAARGGSRDAQADAERRAERRRAKKDARLQAKEAARAERRQAESLQKEAVRAERRRVKEERVRQHRAAKRSRTETTGTRQ
jgi:hypothetical protein